MRNADALLSRSAQDDLLSIRQDLMTVYREVSADDPRLFPLRYTRTTPRHRAPVTGTGGREAAPPEVPLLLIPDGPGMGSVLPYDGTRRALARRGVEVLMMEHRGVGLSRLDAEGRDLPRHAMHATEVLADLVAVLDHARVPQVAVHGTGYGGYLAQALAALHPDRVFSLVLDSPLTSAEDERAGQRALRAHYWDGEVPATSTTAAALRRMAEQGVVDARHAGPVVLAVHEHGGPAAVRDLVDLLVQGRGRLTWSSIRQVLAQDWLQSTPYIVEHELAAPIAHTELGYGHAADGGPMDPLVLARSQARAVAPFAGEPWDMPALAATITAPTTVLAGSRDLVRPPQIARDLAARIPGAALLEIPGAGHGLLDTRGPLAQVVARWATSGLAADLAGMERELAALPATGPDSTLTSGLRLAIAAERLSPWRLRMEWARTRHQESLADPSARRNRTAKV